MAGHALGSVHTALVHAGYLLGAHTSLYAHMDLLSYGM